MTPTLNQGGYLEHTLRSVAAQTHAVLEHIVVDGGSTDDTLAILERAAATAGGQAGGRAGGLRWISEADHGMYEAINKGLRLAKGEVLAYLNSDDAWFPWAVETAVAAFEAHPEADLVYGDGLKLDEATGGQRLRLSPPFDRLSLAHYESLTQPAVFWRRRVLERIGGFDERLRYVGDLDYWLRAADGPAVVHVDEVLAVERIHEARLSTARAEAMAAEDRAMRMSHGADLGPSSGSGSPGASGWSGGRDRAARRHKLWQRRLWLRFLAAWLAGDGDRDRPWRRFLADGGVTVRPGRVLLGQVPFGFDRYLGDAVVSNVAQSLLRDSSDDGRRVEAPTSV